MVNARLYPEILFHFTKTQQDLFNILKDTFVVSYAREKIVGPKKSKEFGAPMVSFCDLRLSELKTHINSYGSYGIGLSKEWANRSNLNPVFYMSQSCSVTDDLLSNIEQLFQHWENISDPATQSNVADIYSNLQNIWRYVKNYEGDLSRGGTFTPNHRFAEEREWRYVPLLKSNIFPFVPISRIATPDQKASLNAQISDMRLHFEPDDIKYLVVKQDDERLPLIEHLYQAKSRFDGSTIQRLSSRILTSKQIEDDF